MTTVVVAERSEVMARGNEAVLQKVDCQIAAICTSEAELSPALQSIRPDLVIFGRGVPSSPGLLDTIPNTRGIVLRERIEGGEALMLAAQGIIGILHTEAGLPKYRACIGSVRENCMWIDPDFREELLQQREKKASDLTSREIEIIERVQRGWRNKQIAHGLGVTEGTVKMHLHHIFTKLRLTTRTELAIATAHTSSGGPVRQPAALGKEPAVGLDRLPTVNDPIR